MPGNATGHGEWVRSELAADKPLCAAVDGFTLHADLVAPQHDPKRLQRLLRYSLAPAAKRAAQAASEHDSAKLTLANHDADADAFDHTS